MTEAGRSDPPAGRPARRSELFRRVLSAAVLAGAAVAATWFGGLPFAALWSVAGACVVAEWLLLIGPGPVAGVDRRLPALRLLAAAGVGALPLLVALEWAAIATASAVLAVVAVAGWIVLAFSRGAADDDWRRRFGNLIVLWAAAGLLAGALVGIVPVLTRAVPAIGVTLVAWMFAVVWTTDVAAYFSGRAIGGPKLWPRVSPNKTWSGACGGALGGTLAGWLVWLVGSSSGGEALPAAGTVLALSCLASIAGQGGDLAESALKRRAGVKDSGRIIPGHGGVLDRVDSFVVMCLLMAIGLASGIATGQ